MKAVVDGVDHVARSMESKWGVGRLRLLVDDELRTRFDRQVEKWGVACQQYEPSGIKRHGDAMRRAWSALDTAATKAGALALEPETWESRLENGSVLVVCKNNVEAYAVARAERGKRDIQVWSLDEVARVISARPEIGEIKKHFPGATVKSVCTKESFDDSIPF
jgi:hypothetical protein